MIIKHQSQKTMYYKSVFEIFYYNIVYEKFFTVDVFEGVFEIYFGVFLKFKKFFGIF